MTRLIRMSCRGISMRLRERAASAARAARAVRAARVARAPTHITTYSTLDNDEEHSCCEGATSKIPCEHGTHLQYDMIHALTTLCD